MLEMARKRPAFSHLELTNLARVRNMWALALNFSLEILDHKYPLNDQAKLVSLSCQGRRPAHQNQMAIIKPPKLSGKVDCNLELRT